MSKNKSNIKSFAVNKINDYSKIQGGVLAEETTSSPESRLKPIGSGTNSCGDTFKVYGHYFLGIHYGTDVVTPD